MHLSRHTKRAVCSTGMSEAFSSRQLIVHMCVYMRVKLSACACLLKLFNLTYLTTCDELRFQLYPSREKTLSSSRITSKRDCLEKNRVMRRTSFCMGVCTTWKTVHFKTVYNMGNSPFENCVQHRKCLLYIKTVSPRKQSIWKLQHRKCLLHMKTVSTIWEMFYFENVLAETLGFFF